MGQFESIIDEIDFEDRKGVLDYNLTMKGVCDKIKNGRFKKIVIICGAGISCNAGIPDFRTPTTGIYETLGEYNLPEPESLFDINFFRSNPEPFYKFMKSLCVKDIYPTLSHYLIRLLDIKGLLLRCYTQNIDALETLAGISRNKLVEAHGSLSTSYCISCLQKYPAKLVLNSISSGTVPYCNNGDCHGIIKPSIVFYGEQLPTQFNALATNDMMAADLLIVMGTSLTVEPVASLVDMVTPLCARMLLNNVPVGPFIRKHRDNYRDVLCLGDLDDLVKDFASEMGWSRDLANSKRMGDLNIDSELHPDKFSAETTTYEKLQIGIKKVVSNLSLFPCHD